MPCFGSSFGLSDGCLSGLDLDHDLDFNSAWFSSLVVRKIETRTQSVFSVDRCKGGENHQQYQYHSVNSMGILLK